MTSPSHIAENRIVLTYTPDKWPVGVLTGFERDGGFYLEHVITFPGANAGDLVGLLSQGFLEMRRRKYAFVSLCIPRALPTSRKLERVARWFGFALQKEQHGVRHFLYKGELNADHPTA